MLILMRRQWPLAMPHMPWRMSMGSSSPPKHTQRMKMNWHVLDCLPHQVDHILDCLPRQVDHVHVKRGGNHTCGSQPEQCGFKGVVLLLLGFKVLELVVPRIRLNR